ncbi:MAG: glycoside hydrolase family 5 protein, partial [Oscillospiraceae bacterium]
MKKLLKKIVCCALGAATMLTMSVSTGISSFATDKLTGLSAQQIVKEMGIGWNLGNSLDCSGINFKDTADKANGLSEWYETGWSNPVTTKAMIDKVKAEGFNTIRIPVTWGEKVSGDDYTINDEWMARVKEIVDWAYEDDMFVILNTHHEEMTGFEDEPKSTDENLKYKSGWLRLENYESSSKELVAIWKQIAKEFADYDQHLIFEVMNEPRYVDDNGIQDWDGTEEWYEVINKLNADGLEAIRSVAGNEERAVMLPTYAAQLKEDPMKSFVLPDDKNLIVSIHAYEPYALCLAKGDQGEEYTTEFTEEGKQLLDEKFALLDKYFINKGIPVVIGETSITNRNNPEDRREWCKYYATLARERNIPLVIWDANKFGKDDPKVGENHGWLNRNLLKWYDKQTTDTLVYTFYGYEVPGDDYYYPEEDLAPTEDKFDIHTLWTGNATAPAWGQCTTIQLPSGGITAEDLNTKGTLIEIDYDNTTYGSPHLVLYSISNNYWVDIYPTDIDVADGRAYFAYPTIVNTWEGMTKTTDLSSVQQMFVSAAFTPVTGTALKVCIPKEGAEIPDPYVDPYEDRNFWDEHTVYGPQG